MIEWLDKYVSPHIPMWLVAVLVSAGFAFIGAAALGLIQSLVMLDISMLWAVWPRAVFGVFTVVFTTLLMVTK